jgi:hypothetical protein
MRRRIAKEQTESPLSKVRNFLQGAFGDALTFDEVREDMRSLAASNTRGIHLALAALDRVLADPTVEPEFARLVGWDGNWVLDDPSNAGARRFLEEVAQMLRDVLRNAPDEWRGAYDLRPPIT